MSNVSRPSYRSMATPYKKRKTSSSASTQQQLAELKRKINQLKPEVKCVTVSGQLANVASGVGAIDYVSQIAQGVSLAGRIGDKIRLTQIDFRIQGVDVLSSSSNFVNRIIVIRDNQNTGALPTINGTASAVLTSASTLSLPVPSNSDRFTILKDYTYSGISQANGQVPGHFWFSMKTNIVMDFTSTSALVASAGKNSLFVIALTDATTATQDWNYVCNLHFTDV